MRATPPFAKSGRAARRWWGAAATLAVLALAAVLLRRQLGQYSLSEIRGAFAAIGARDFLLIGLCAAGSYFCLTLSETVGARYAGARLSYPRIAFASFVSLSIGHNLGFAALSSGAVRYRIYSRWGLRLGDVARIIALSGVTVALGHATLAALALLLRPQLAAQTIGLPQWATAPLGVALALVVGCYLLLAWRAAGAAVRLWRWRLWMPPLRLAAAQVAVGAANTACVAAALYSALSAAMEVDYFATATVYVLASVAAIASHVPGGLGVLEAVVMAFSPMSLTTFGALVAFRVVYFLVPLGLGAPLFGAFELRRRWRPQGPAFATPQPRGGER